jgi:outer membrane protein insertion porin family
MLHLKSKIVFILLIIYSVTFPQTIKTIKIIGAKNFTQQNYLNWINIPLNTKLFPWIADTIKLRIGKNLARNGYLNYTYKSLNTIYSEDSANVDIVLSVDEGEPSVVTGIFIEGVDSAEIKLLLENFEFIIGSTYLEEQLEESIKSILSYYEENSYPFAKIIISSIALIQDSIERQNSVNISMRVDKNIECKIDNIEVKGNTTTKDYIIIREVMIEKGEKYSQKKIQLIPSKLNRLRFFEPVKEPTFYINSKNEGVLSIELKEKQTNNFDGIVGYIPGNGKNEKGYLTGLINVNLRNLFGTARAAAIRWQKIDRFSQELELKYLEPWFLDFPFNIQAGLFQRKQDTSYVIRKLDGLIEFLATDQISLGLTISSEQVIPTINEYSVFTVYNSTLISTGVNLKIDSRNDPYSPTKGFLLINAYSFSRKKISGPAKYIYPSMQTKISLQRIMIDLSLYYEFFNRNVIHLSLHGKELKGSLLEVSDLYKLGGNNSLRGYRENQFIGSRVAWSNLEYRLLLTQRSFAFLFFDMGYYQRKADEERNIKEISGFKIGYGLGLNLETGLGVLSVSFGLAKGDSFNEGKIHIGIVNEF